jgi:hypothetical protein
VTATPSGLVVTGTPAAGKAPVAADASGSAVWTDLATQAELDVHTALTTSAHGGVVASNDARLTDTRTPTDASVTAAKVAPALKPSGTAAASDEALRALGTTASTAAAGDHGHTLAGDVSGPVGTTAIGDGKVTPSMFSVPARPFVYLAGSYYCPPGTATTAVTAANSETRFCRLWLPKGRTVDRLGLNVTVAGSAGSTLRLGMYAASVTTGLPDGLPLIDGGTIDGTSATFQEKTVSYALDEGAWFWLCTTCQGATGATPTVTTLASTSVPEEGVPMFSTALSTVGLRVSGFAAGPLPTATGATFLPGTAPRPIVRLT